MSCFPRSWPGRQGLLPGRFWRLVLILVLFKFLISFDLNLILDLVLFKFLIDSNFQYVKHHFSGPFMCGNQLSGVVSWGYGWASTFSSVKIWFSDELTLLTPFPPLKIHHCFHICLPLSLIWENSLQFYTKSSIEIQSNRNYDQVRWAWLPRSVHTDFLLRWLGQLPHVNPTMSTQTPNKYTLPSHCLSFLTSLQTR